MMSLWLFAWLAFIGVFLLSPIGYGWGYRRWGVPYPSFVQRRRSQMAFTTRRSATIDHEAWGRGGDALWIAAIVCLFWPVVALWFRW